MDIPPVSAKTNPKRRRVPITIIDDDAKPLLVEASPPKSILKKSSPAIQEVRVRSLLIKFTSYPYLPGRLLDNTAQSTSAYSTRSPTHNTQPKIRSRNQACSRWRRHLQSKRIADRLSYARSPALYRSQNLL